MRERFIRDVLSNRNNHAILDRWPALRLADGWLVAGCLFQTAWNLVSGQEAEAKINDYDLFYFDPIDLSDEAEHQQQARADRVLRDLQITVEVKNQARVHLWYESYFGHPCPPLRSSCDGIDRFLVIETRVGIRPVGSGFEIHAPHGVESIYAGRLSPNPLTDDASRFQKKARSYAARWHWLRIE